MTDIAIATSKLGKRYRLGLHQRGYDTLRETIMRTAGRSWRRNTGSGHPTPPEDSELWALRDLTLTIRQGEVVGVIGHNGAGKSTLLKILSRITEPTDGWAEVRGRVSALLEVGTGFHPELTGRENIYLSGAILGMHRTEIRSRFDEIVAFAEVERFLDTPVKRYSSGMSVRLAFAVAAHLEPEILLVDEVLAVGDAAFQRKSVAKMEAVAGDGRTVVFVSHNLAIIQALCARGVLLDRGQLVTDGPVGETIAYYLRTLERTAADDLLERDDRDRRGWAETQVRAIEVRDASGGNPQVVVAGHPATILVYVTDVLPLMECRLTILNSLGQPVTTLDSENPASTDTRSKELGPCVRCDIAALPLLPGRYRVDVVLKGRDQIQDGLQGAAFFDVESGLIHGRSSPPMGSDGDVVLPHTWQLPA